MLKNPSMAFFSSQSEKRGFRFAPFFKRLARLKNGGTSMIPLGGD